MGQGRRSDRSNPNVITITCSRHDRSLHTVLLNRSGHEVETSLYEDFYEP